MAAQPGRDRLFRWQLARGEQIDESLRERAFLSVTETINGVEVKPFTLRHLHILSHIQSPFIYGGVRKIEDIGLFLWVVSPNYSAEVKTRLVWNEKMHGCTFWNRIRRHIYRAIYRRWGFRLGMEEIPERQLFMHQLTRHPRWEHFYHAINRYLRRAFRDPPPVPGAGKDISTCYTASVIHKLAKAYGWDEPTILDMPMTRIYQYLKWIQVDDNPATPQFNPTAQVVNERFKDSLPGVKPHG